MNRFIILTIMMLVVYSANAAVETPDDIVNNYFELLKNDQIQESIDFLYSKFRLPEHLEESLIEKLPDAIAENKQFGKLHRCDNISSRGIKNVYTIKQFICIYEYKPIRYVFSFYKPNGIWKVTGVAFYGDVDEIMSAELIKDFKSSSKLK